MVDALAVARFSSPFDILEDGPEVAAKLVELCRTVPGA
jgi:hypothetical protein